MTDAYNGRIAAANDKDKKNFKIVWTNNLYTVDSWVIMKGSPNKAQAETFLVFVNDPQNQKNLPPKIPYGPPAKASPALIDNSARPRGKAGTAATCRRNPRSRRWSPTFMRRAKQGRWRARRRGSTTTFRVFARCCSAPVVKCPRS